MTEEELAEKFKQLTCEPSENISTEEYRSESTINGDSTGSLETAPGAQHNSQVTPSHDADEERSAPGSEESRVSRNSSDESLVLQADRGHQLRKSRSVKRQDYCAEE